MIKGGLIAMLFEDSGNNRNPFMVVALHILAFLISQKIRVNKQKFKGFLFFGHETTSSLLFILPANTEQLSSRDTANVHIK